MCVSGSGAVVSDGFWFQIAQHVPGDGEEVVQGNGCFPCLRIGRTHFCGDTRLGLFPGAVGHLVGAHHRIPGSGIANGGLGLTHTIPMHLQKPNCTHYSAFHLPESLHFLLPLVALLQSVCT